MGHRFEQRARPQGYYDYDDTGYRINLANNTKYAINLGAYFSVDAIPADVLDATGSDARRTP